MKQPETAFKKVEKKILNGNNKVSEVLRETKVGGTDEAPIWKVTIFYMGIGLDETGTDLKELNEKICQRWLDENDDERDGYPGI